jgi:hypothetical protein
VCRAWDVRVRGWIRNANVCFYATAHAPLSVRRNILINSNKKHIRKPWPPRMVCLCESQRFRWFLFRKFAWRFSPQRVQLYFPSGCVFTPEECAPSVIAETGDDCACGFDDTWQKTEKIRKLFAGQTFCGGAAAKLDLGQVLADVSTEARRAF